MLKLPMLYFEQPFYTANFDRGVITETPRMNPTLFSEDSTLYINHYHNLFTHVFF